MSTSCPNRIKPLFNNNQANSQTSYPLYQPGISSNGVVITKSADKTNVVVGNTIVYTVTITNNSSTTISNIFFWDTIPNGTSYVANSFNLVGYGPISGANPNSGVDLTTVVGALPPTASCAITFIIQYNELPCPKQIINTANVSYTY